jgi:ketopantoate hydroxymethyltransferase
MLTSYDTLTAGIFEQAGVRAILVGDTSGQMVLGYPDTVPVTMEHLIPMLRIPTVGIGAGPHCDAQIMVWHDLAGLTTGRAPRFVKRYAGLAETLHDAVRQYVTDVADQTYPDEAHSYA